MKTTKIIQTSVIAILMLLGTISCGSSQDAIKPKHQVVTTTTYDLSFDGILPSPTPEQAVKLANEKQWVAELEKQRVDKAVAVQAEQDRQKAVVAAIYKEQHKLKVQPQPKVSPPTTHKTPSTAYQASNGSCGGNLPPCYVVKRESGGNIRAKNPSSSASGKWQFVDGTWNGYGGYKHASDAPESVQDAKAAEVYDNGRGCSHWSC